MKRLNPRRRLQIQTTGMFSSVYYIGMFDINSRETLFNSSIAVIENKKKREPYTALISRAAYSDKNA